MLNVECGSASQGSFLQSKRRILLHDARYTNLILTVSVICLCQMQSMATAPPPSIHPTVKKHLGKAPAGVVVKQEQSDLPSTQKSRTSLPSSSALEVSSAKVSDFCTHVCVCVCPCVRVWTDSSYRRHLRTALQWKVGMSYKNCKLYVPDLTDDYAKKLEFAITGPIRCKNSLQILLRW